MATPDPKSPPLRVRELRRTTISVTGTDREAWLNGVITQDVPKPGGACYGLSLTRPGKIVADLFCLATPDSVLVATPPGVQSELLSAWERMLVMEDAELSDVSDRYLWFLVVGSEHSRLRLPEGGICAALEYLPFGSALLLLPAGADARALGVPLLSDDEWLALRLEQRVPEFGRDFDSSDRPHEASLDQRAVSWTKGCYLGQEVVCMQEMRGKVRRRLEVLSAREPFATLPEPGSALTDRSGATVGRVTSVVNDRQNGRGILMAEVEVAALEGPVLLDGVSLQRVARAGE